MKPGEDKWSIDLLPETFPKFFNGMLSQMVLTRDDLYRPVGELIIKWIDEVVGKDKDTPYKTRTGSINDIKLNTHYRKLVSMTIELRDHKIK